MKKLYMLCAIALLALQAIAQPSNAPSDPTKNTGDVISVFSDTYTNITGTNFSAAWGQSTVSTDETIAGNTVKKLTNFNYQGVEFYNNQPVNLSNMEYLHIDIWSEDCTEFDLYLIYGGPEQFKKLTLTPSAWNSFDIPLSDFTNLGVNLANVYQFKFVSTPFGGTTVYYDNVYFWKDASTPTITGFSIPEKYLGDTDFTLTPPTSNSNGAFSYTSSNTNVATVTGDVVHIVGVGTTIIKATQAADGIYNSTSVITNLVISYPQPTTVPNTPSHVAGDVISIYSEAYTNITGVNYNPFWGQQTSVTEQTIVGNKVIKLANLNFQGVDFGQNLDVSDMDYLHIDLWSPDCTAFDLFLIYGGEQYKRLTLTAPSTWHSFDIALSEFENLGVNLANVYQFKFVSATPSSGTTVFYDNVYFWKNSTLPVRLSEFKASRSANSVVLNWQTASESNNKGFAIERSNNGTDWSQLKFIDGAGTTSTPNNYTFTDYSPVVNGINYYRLEQIDNDANTTYSDIKSVDFSVRQQISEFSHPNPVNNNFTVSVSTITTDNATLYLTNAEGKIIKTIRLTQQNSNTDIVLDIQNCTPGVYSLSLKDGKNTKASKLLIY